MSLLPNVNDQTRLDEGEKERTCTICNKPILYEPWMTGRDVVLLIKRELDNGNDEVYDLLHEVDCPIHSPVHELCDPCDFDHENDEAYSSIALNETL